MNKILIIILSLIVFFIDVYSQLNSPDEFEHSPIDTIKLEPVSDSFISTSLLGVINLYQRHISPVRGMNCPMYPSCSEYSSQAISRSGALGIFMTADRLLRCGQDTNNFQLLQVGKAYRYYDPVNKFDR